MRTYNALPVSNETILRDGVFFIGDGKFAYNDGDADEKYIEMAIATAKDVSSDSSELEKFIKNWPSQYHLSSERANCYRAFNFPRESRVLEIGSGCGAISRYIGERVSHLVSLEGSPRRARITRSRTRDLKNVTVICGSFEDVEFIDKFDFVICNGVLEYAPLFIKGENAVDAFVKVLSSLVKNDGSVIIAIENKLGLRYFSSGKEEHTGVMFDGLENYSRSPGGPRTFGKDELNAILLKAFASVEFYLPCPDYKFPKAILSEPLLKIVDCSELYSCLDSYDYSTVVTPRFHEGLVWRSISQSGLLSHFSNSFFVIAGSTKQKLTDEEWYGQIFSRNRLPGLVSHTQIIRDSHGNIRTRKIRAGDAQNASDAKDPEKAVNTELWLVGPSVHTLLVQSLLQKRRCNLADRISYPVSVWWKSIQRHLGEGNTLPADMFDAIWQNAIYTQNGVEFFDKEWVHSNRISAVLLIYRAVICFTIREIHFVSRWPYQCRMSSQIEFIKAISKVVGINYSFGDLYSAIKTDISFAEESRGEQRSALADLIRLYIPIGLLHSKARTLRLVRSVTDRIYKRLF